MKTSLGRDPIGLYGSLQETLEKLRTDRRMDLNARNWHRAHPNGSHSQWRKAARECLREGLHYDPSGVEMNPAVIERIETPHFIRERIEFNTTPWFRVPGYFYVPKNVPLPAPGLIVFHEWGGPMLFGAERVCGEPVNDIIRQHRATYTSGRALADWFASQGYAVICIDAYHFGRRAPRGIHGLPEQFDAAQLDVATLEKYEAIVRQQLYLGVRQLNWAGTTWAGVNFVDDSRCIDYLQSRAEVIGDRIGVTGLSGGGWRTNMLAALDPRITAAVSVGWMTTGDTQQQYNVEGVIGTFCLLPGVWDRMDVPDLISIAAPAACMVVSGTQDTLFPPKGQHEAAEQIAAAYDWAGCPSHFRNYAPDKPHCYDDEIQSEALSWLNRHLQA